MSRIIETILSMRWAMTGEALDQILRVVERDFDPFELAKAMHGHGEYLKYLEEGELSPDAILAQRDDPLPGTKNVTRRDGVAILPVIGPIFPRANLFTQFSGGVSISELTLDFNAALRDPSIHSIVLNIDSPGGNITGIGEFAAMLFAAQGKKSVVSYISGLGASAAYWIAAGTSKIYVDESSELGSIGVVAGYTDTTKRDEARGVRAIEIISSISPKKRASPLTDEGREEIQRVVNDLAKVFVGSVARYRGLEEETVLTDFGRGGLIVGAEAVTRKMADETGSLEGVISLLIEQHFEPSQSLFSGGIDMGKGTAGNESTADSPLTVTVEGVKDGSPEVHSAIHGEGAKAGAEAERARITSIQALKVPAGYEHIVTENLLKPEATAESVAKLILDAQAAKAEGAGVSVQKDANKLAEKIQGLTQDGGNGEEAQDAALMGAMVAGASGE